MVPGQENDARSKIAREEKQNSTERKQRKKKGRSKENGNS